MKYLSLFLIPLIFTLNWSNKAPISGAELLEKSLQYHDPGNRWNTQALNLRIAELRPTGASDTVNVSFDIPKEFFNYTSKNDTLQRVYEVNGDTCRLEYNGSSDIPEAAAKKYRMNCEFAKVFRNYYTYLWGLPMKLKDPGTIIHEEVSEEVFQGVNCYKMKVTYEEGVGKDIWYFYFKKGNYALHGYKFYKDETKNDGEYITLEGEEQISKMKFPKARKWYYNKDGKFLGEDVLLEPFE